MFAMSDVPARFFARVFLIKTDPQSFTIWLTISGILLLINAINADFRFIYFNLKANEIFSGR